MGNGEITISFKLHMTIKEINIQHFCLNATINHY